MGSADPQVEASGLNAAEDPGRETENDRRIPTDKHFFKIGEVAKITGVKPYVLRYWETEFPWLKPTKTSSRQRMYRRQDVALIFQIQRLRYEERRTIADAKKEIRRLRGEKGGKRRRRKKPTPQKAPDIPVAELNRALNDMRQAVVALLNAVED